MSGLLGLGTFANNFMKGYEQSEDREYLKQQRDFERTQQQRKLDEQKREDEFRTGIQGVATTEQVIEPAKTTMYGQDAPVVRDDEGNLLPGAAETPAKTVTRQRNREDVLMQYADIARKSGKIDQAMKFELDAEGESHKRASALYRQWAGSLTPQADLLTEAQKVSQIFNGDKLPAQVRGIRQAPDGKGVVAQMYDKNTQQTMDFRVENVQQLRDWFESYYSPETWAAYTKSKREAALKAQEKAAEPYTLKPGEERRVGNQVIGRNDTAYTIGPNGEPVPLKPGAGSGSGTGSKKGAKTVVDEASEYLKDAMGGKGDGSPEGAARYTRAQSYLDGIFTTNPNVSPRTAAAIAADASADPTKITLQLDNRTGQVSKVYANPDFEGGRQFNLGPNSGTVAEMEKVVGKSGMQQAVTGMVAQLSSVVPPEQQQAFQQQLIQAATDPKAREQVIAAARASGQDVQAMTRQLDLIKTYAAPAPGPGRTTKTDVGGLNMPKTDPNSPAGRAQARQAQLRAEADAKEAKRLEDQKALSAQFRADARTLSGVELERKYDRMRGQLPREDQIELRRLAAQAYRSAQ